MFGLDPRLKTATELFHGGRLAEAAALCGALAADGDASAAFDRLHGELLLLQGDLDAAGQRLARALAADPTARRPRALLAETWRRAGRLTEAAALYRDLGRVALAEVLGAAAAAAGGRAPASPVGAAGPIALPWLTGDGPALIEATVGPADGGRGRTGRFLIDTGVGETLLDPTLAAAAGVRGLGTEAIAFPAGPAGQVTLGLLPWLDLGGRRWSHLPVQVFDTRRALAGLLPGPVDGVIGSAVLGRLPVALDFARRELRLGAAAPPDGGEALYLAPEYCPLLSARVNGRLDTLLLLDTGLSGTGCALALATAVAAGAELADTADTLGHGVASALHARALRPVRLAAAGRNLEGLAAMLLTPFRLERQFGFRVGGLLGDGFLDGGCLWLDIGGGRVRVTGSAGASPR